MGLIENLGRVASVYMDEKEKLQTVGDKRKRTRMGHGFWPHEVLRDAIIFASMLSVLLFYAWLIPPPLHGAADPYAQAGFVFPDWYVLFSYGYLRWGEYLRSLLCPRGHRRHRRPARVRLERCMVGRRPHRHPRWHPRPAALPRRS